LLRREGFTLARANLQKFLIRNLLEARIRDLRKQAVGNAFQQALFGDDAASRVAVTDHYAFEYHAQAYAPSRDYDGRFGNFDFRKHFYGRIGDFDSKEEFECACWLDMQAQQGRLPESDDRKDQQNLVFVEQAKDIDVHVRSQSGSRSS